MIDIMSILNRLASSTRFHSPCLCYLVFLFLSSTPPVTTTPTSAQQAIKSTDEGSFADFCEQWVTYKDPQSGRCLPCSPCPEDHLTVVKCEFDRDTLCRPYSDLMSDHIESVVRSSSSVMVTKKNNSVLIVEQNTVFEQLLGGIEYSPALVTILSLVVFGCVTYIIMQSFKKCKKQRQQRALQDPLQESLLGQEEQEENEKPALDMDEMLAQRFGRSLVTNVYVP